MKFKNNQTASGYLCNIYVQLLGVIFEAITPLHSRIECNQAVEPLHPAVHCRAMERSSLIRWDIITLCGLGFVNERRMPASGAPSTESSERNYFPCALLVGTRSQSLSALPRVHVNVNVLHSANKSSSVKQLFRAEIGILRHVCNSSLLPNQFLRRYG